VVPYAFYIEGVRLKAARIYKEQEVRWARVDADVSRRRQNLNFFDSGEQNQFVPWLASLTMCATMLESRGIYMIVCTVATPSKIATTSTLLHTPYLNQYVDICQDFHS